MYNLCQTSLEWLRHWVYGGNSKIERSMITGELEHSNKHGPELGSMECSSVKSSVQQSTRNAGSEDQSDEHDDQWEQVKQEVPEQKLGVIGWEGNSNEDGGEGVHRDYDTTISDGNKVFRKYDEDLTNYLSNDLTNDEIIPFLKHKDKHVNINYSNDEILLFINENDLSETELNWLKSLGSISETEILDLISSIMYERENKRPKTEGE
jgi:hypothetical protein